MWTVETNLVTRSFESEMDAKIWQSIQDPGSTRYYDPNRNPSA